MKVYVASSFSLIPKVEKVVAELEKAGHKITVKWWAREYEIEGEHIHTQILKKVNNSLSTAEFYSKPETKFSFDADVQGVKDADIFIFVAQDKRRAYNGANVELGIALGQGIPCFALGLLDLSVLYYPVIHCESIEELLKKICAREGGI